MRLGVSWSGWQPNDRPADKHTFRSVADRPAVRHCGYVNVS